MTRVGRASRDQTRPDLTTFPPFGRLTVREWDGTRWLCDCTCGGSIRLTTSNLLYNHVVRCEACRKPATHCAICHGPIVDRPVNATLCGDADCLREYNRRKQAESRENRKASRSPSEV